MFFFLCVFSRFATGSTSYRFWQLKKRPVAVQRIPKNVRVPGLRFPEKIPILLLRFSKKGSVGAVLKKKSGSGADVSQEKTGTTSSPSKSRARGGAFQNCRHPPPPSSFFRDVLYGFTISYPINDKTQYHGHYTDRQSCYHKEKRPANKRHLISGILHT